MCVCLSVAGVMDIIIFSVAVAKRWSACAHNEELARAHHKTPHFVVVDAVVEITRPKDVYVYSLELCAYTQTHTHVLRFGSVCVAHSGRGGNSMPAAAHTQTLKRQFQLHQKEPETLFQYVCVCMIFSLAQFSVWRPLLSPVSEH